MEEMTEVPERTGLLHEAQVQVQVQVQDLNLRNAQLENSLQQSRLECEQLQEQLSIARSYRFASMDSTTDARRNSSCISLSSKSSDTPKKNAKTQPLLGGLGRFRAYFYIFM